MEKLKEWLWVFGIRAREYYYPWTVIVQTKMYLRGFTKANRIFSSTPTLFGLFFFCVGLIQFFLDIPLYILNFLLKRCPESWQNKLTFSNNVKSKVKGLYYGIVGPSSPFVLYLGLFYLLLGGSPNLDNQQSLVDLHRSRTAIAIRDNNGNFIGIHDFQIDGREPALYVDTIPFFFWEMLIFREHKELEFNDQDGLSGFLEGVQHGSYKGVNVFAPLVGVLKTLIGMNGGGGSTPMNFMTKNLYGEGYFKDESNRQKHCPIVIDIHRTLCRKWVEYRSAKDLFPLLSQNDGLEFKRWVSMHVALVKRVQGDLYGIQAASAVLFGKKPKNLTMAEQAILAKAYLLGIQFKENDEEPVQAETCLSSDGTVESSVSWPCFREVSLEQWKDYCASPDDNRYLNPTAVWGCKVQASEELAVSVIERIYVEKRESELEECTELTKEECIDKLDAQFTKLEIPNDPKIPMALEKAYGESTESYDKQIANFGNLRHRVSTFMSGYKKLIQNDLIRHQQTSTDPVVEIRMTMSLKQDYAFRQAIDEILRNLQNEHNFGGKGYPFNKKLLRSEDKDSPINELPQASIRIAVSTLEGEMLLYYLRGKWLEENLQVSEKSQRYPLRPMGSTVKIASAALLVSKGKNALCNKSYAGKRNAGGNKGIANCGLKGNWKKKTTDWNIENSFRKSFNLTFRWGLSKYSNIAELQQVFTDFGMTVNPKVKDTKAKKESKTTGKNNTDKTENLTIPFADYVDNMSFGDAQSTPAQTHRIINKVGHLLLTPEEEYYGIRSVSSFTTLSETKGGSGFTVVSNTDGVGELDSIEKYFPLKYREKMTKVMSAPITGTLRGVAPKLKGGRLVFGKTGTMDTSTGNTKDKYVVGVLEVNDQYYSFSILIGAEDYDEGLIKSIGTSELMRPIIQQVVDGLSVP